jgi:hypothetical protein
MTVVWDKISDLAKHIEDRFIQTGTPTPAHTSEYNWHNAIYSSLAYRRAHIEIVDRRETHKIYILHCTIFPNFNDPSPIWGFDAVCGPNKITGAFHDFSSAGQQDHPMMTWFQEQSAQYKWNKPRELPYWAQRIFSPGMIAAGNVQEGPELDDLCDFAKRSLDYYLENVGITQESLFDFHMAQNKYCYWQKQNPHVVNSMVAMGVEEPVIRRFVNEILFPEVA